MKARHHHYLSQCYLKGFTKNGAKKSKLIVIDLLQKKRFETTPRNVGGLRDFNRINIEGLDQNTIEDSLAVFESEAAAALRKLEKDHSFEGETRTLILNLLALLAVRSPEMRENWRGFQAQIVEQMMGLSLATRERWESQMQQLRDSGKEVNETLTYEDMKKFHESKEYNITVAREHHIHMEFVGLEAILPTLDNRNWVLLKATDETGPFITTDNPVNLTWKEPETIPPVYRSSPGHGMSGTQLYFPVSKDIALVGEFDGPEGVFEATTDLVAALNSKMLWYTYKQLYAPKISFNFHGTNGEILNGRHLLKHIDA